VKITVHGGTDMARALEGWQVPDTCTELILDAPEARRFTNCLLRSPINCRVRVTETELPEVSYAGLFSMCQNLSHQPFVEMGKCVNMAAMFKGCESARFNLFAFRDTANVRDMRQCLWGCTNISGIGLSSWDFSGLASRDAMRNFAGRTTFRTTFYDALIESLHDQAALGTLPTPMDAVNFGNARYSPSVATERQFLIDYGWEILDGGIESIELSPIEKAFSQSVDSRLEAMSFPGDIDLSPVCTSARGGILISPSHLLYVKHYRPTPGQYVSFWKGERAIVDRVTAGDWDIAVASLRDPVSIRPALVFSNDWKRQMPSLAGPPSQYPSGQSPPCVWFTGRNQVRISDLMYADDSPPVSRIKASVDPLRAAYGGNAVAGDSGSPVCCVYGDRLVVAFALMDSMGNGIFTGSVREWLDEVTQGMVQELVAA